VFEPPKETKITRLNYIGSKFQLLEWLTENILEYTNYEDFKGKTVCDLFGGTGIVSYHFRNLNANVISNDAELYSYIITYAFTKSSYNNSVKTIIEYLQKELDDKNYKDYVGYITENYSPYDKCERKFFTIDNAKRIDYVRKCLEEIEYISEQDYNFVLACILISADAVSNVPAVYGCYLKNFKEKAKKPFTLKYIHTNEIQASKESKTHCGDVLDSDFLSSFESDIVYLDPPYNERQYSKNYFPLNMIAKNPSDLDSEPPLKGKTGIPTDCFISPFCKKGKVVEEAFEKLFKELKTKFIFLSYNSESLVSKEKMIKIMEKYGSVAVVERTYKRFKSFEYNKDVSINEYLFCLKKS
jgi:adenine-specific DNA-methyltransferase